MLSIFIAEMAKNFKIMEKPGKTNEKKAKTLNYLSINELIL